MASKSVTVSPPAAAAAGCTATCTSYYEWHDGESADNYLIAYQVQANPANGWGVASIQWVLYDLDAGTGRTVTKTGVSEFPPSPPDIDYPGADDLTDSSTVYGGHSYGRYEVRNVVVTFARVHTNLLVNSSNLSSPVQLVYDPTTGNLVADY